jgi:GTP cyclohydrolase II
MWTEKLRVSGPIEEQPSMSNVVTVAGRKQRKQQEESSIELYGEAPLPTARGLFRTVVFRDRRTGAEHVAMVMGDVAGESVPVRVHSECLTSEVLGSLKCDCRAQLDRALDHVAERGRGVLIYLRQEGRGIGLGNKIRAYALQAKGHDTYEANRLLGFPDDLRRYDVAAEMLRLLRVRSVELITNNPLKVAGLTESGIPVRARIPLPSPANPHNVEYLRVKRERTGHLIETDEEVEEVEAAG